MYPSCHQRHSSPTYKVGIGSRFELLLRSANQVVICRQCIQTLHVPGKKVCLSSDATSILYI
jgi:hypothetical protein